MDGEQRDTWRGERPFRTSISGILQVSEPALLRLVTRRSQVQILPPLPAVGAPAWGFFIVYETRRLDGKIIRA